MALTEMNYVEGGGDVELTYKQETGTWGASTVEIPISLTNKTPIGFTLYTMQTYMYGFVCPDNENLYYGDVSSSVWASVTMQSDKYVVNHSAPISGTPQFRAYVIYKD